MYKCQQLFSPPVPSHELCHDAEVEHGGFFNCLIFLSLNIQQIFPGLNYWSIVCLWRSLVLWLSEKYKLCVKWINRTVYPTLWLVGCCAPEMHFIFQTFALGVIFCSTSGLNKSSSISLGPISHLTSEEVDWYANVTKGYFVCACMFVRMLCFCFVHMSGWTLVFLVREWL